MTRKHLFLALAITVGVAQAAAQPLPLDYSYCGYRMSERPLPSAPVAVYVAWHEGDNSARIQRAIDYVASLRPDRTTGLRGAVLLGKGTFSLSAPLRIKASGVVVRGADKRATVLMKEGVDRGALIYIEGRDDRQYLDTMALTTPLVAVGSNRVGVSGRLSVGDEVMIVRPSTERWIASLGCSSFGGGQDLGYFGWHAGEIDVTWSRRVTAFAGHEATLDAPLTMALDSAMAHTRVVTYRWPGRVEESGVENLTLSSAYNPAQPTDEDHCWDGVYIANARNCWVRRIDFSGFAGSAVVVQRSAGQITVEDCISRHPVSEVGGLRRRTFFVLGEKCLFQRCYSYHGINDFSAGQIAAGPNAFVQCDSYASLGFSGSVGSWATGLLFDNVNIDGHDIRFTNLRIEKFGAGWNTANSMAYQCSAAGIVCDSVSPRANNYAYGCWAEFSGTGRFDESNNHVKPRSIFAALLEKRLGRDVSAQTRTLMRNTNASSSPTIDEARRMTIEARRPRTTLEMWIDSASFDADVTGRGAKNIDHIKLQHAPSPAAEPQELAIVGGKLLVGNRLLVGGRHNTPWWSGKTRYNTVEKAQYAVTRFVPGQEGRGLTDRIDSVVAQMNREHTVWYNQNYGLWYDRRRDDHERVRRRDGDVWAPFYEQPFARSGKDTAWDGLSRYDLTRLNPWYFARISELARKGAPNGIVVAVQHYFQHNILEAGAHWVDAPWRSANNINNTGFPEPVPFTGDKRVFMAERFYDVSHPVRRELHRQYILKTLDALASQPNVVHSIGEEFTGPLHFVRFWLNTVRQWEDSTGRHATIALATTRDVQDSIMADPRYRKVVDIIDIEQWYYHNRGLYAPQGGVNMAPRQYARKIKAGSVRFEDVYRSVAECRQAYPDKAVVYFAPKYPEMAWAVLMAGGSCPAVGITDGDLLTALASMQPQTPHDGLYTMRSPAGHVLVYAQETASAPRIDLAPGIYALYAIDRQTGQTTLVKRRQRISDALQLPGKGIYWIKKTN